MPNYSFHAVLLRFLDMAGVRPAAGAHSAAQHPFGLSLGCLALNSRNVVEIREEGKKNHVKNGCSACSFQPAVPIPATLLLKPKSHRTAQKASQLHSFLTVLCELCTESPTCGNGKPEHKAPVATACPVD